MFFFNSNADKVVEGKDFGSNVQERPSANAKSNKETSTRGSKTPEDRAKELISTILSDNSELNEEYKEWTVANKNKVIDEKYVSLINHMILGVTTAVYADSALKSTKEAKNIICQFVEELIMPVLDSSKRIVVTEYTKLSNVTTHHCALSYCRKHVSSDFQEKCTSMIESLTKR